MCSRADREGARWGNARPADRRPKVETTPTEGEPIRDVEGYNAPINHVVVDEQCRDEPEIRAYEGGPGRPDAKVHITFFSNFAATRLTTDKVTMVELRERVLQASRREKAALPWLKLAVFGAKRTAKGSLRHDANVLEITGIELDYDDAKIAFDAAQEALSAMGINALIYTSPPHSAEAPRYRIIAPTSRPLPPDLRGKLAARVNGFMKAKLDAKKFAAPESLTLSQAFFYGYVMNKPGLVHRAEVIAGDFIDQRDDLAEYELSGAKIDSGSKSTADNSKTAGDTQDDGRAHGFDAILAEMDDGDGLDRFNDPLTRGAASYVATTAHPDLRLLKKVLRGAIDKAPKKDTPERADSIKRYMSDAYLDGVIQSAVGKYSAASDSASAPLQPILATPYLWTEPENIPRREFLYGRRLIRKYATATIAPGGVGKTALEIGEVLSMVSGKALLGVQTEQLRMWLWSLEDSREEMQRRIQATARHHDLTQDDIGIACSLTAVANSHS
jgi:hypothetical protein